MFHMHRLVFYAVHVIYQHNSSEQNVALNNAAYNRRISMAGGAPVGLMAAEEIRVDCALLSADSGNVITSSIYGPPQVWDMRVTTTVNM